MVDRLDAEDGLLALARGVIPGPLAERTFDRLVLGIGEALDHDLGVGRDRQTGDRTLHHAVRRAADATGPVVLRDAVRDLGARREEQQRVAAGDERNGHLLAAREPLVAVLPAVLSR